MTANSPTQNLVCGGVAGVAVDVLLFPLDSIKTRMQSEKGFLRSGGLRGLYKGMSPMALASFPGAATFFVTYESVKRSELLRGLLHERDAASTAAPASSPYLAQIVAASCGETAACLIRVPSENVKQNLQTKNYDTVRAALVGIARTEGHGFYKGYFATLLREIPFSMIQFPLWEWGKVFMERRVNGGKAPCDPLQSAACGSLSGTVAAALTTPLDVVKTRLMTSPGKYSTVPLTLRLVVREEGAGALLKGLKPRVTWISIGGFLFFGVYEETQRVYTRLVK